jgi:ATP-binding cassette, subfamily B, bacterial
MTTPGLPALPASPPPRVRRLRLGPRPAYLQHDSSDCGPTCLRTIAKYHGRTLTLGRLRELANVGRFGASILGLSEAAEAVGFRTLAARLPWTTLARASLPCVVHWKQLHFVVVYAVDRRGVLVADPSYGLVRYQVSEFLRHWLGPEQEVATRASRVPVGVALLLEPTPAFYEPDRASQRSESRTGIALLVGYLRPYRNLLRQLLLAMVFGSLAGLIFPFLTQAIVDVGIGQQNLGFIKIVVVAQLALFAGRATVDFIRGRILLYVGSRINITVLTDFIAKLMRLPARFFATRQLSDILQRLSEQTRLEKLLTSSTLEAIFSLTYLAVFGAVLAFYDLRLFTVFVAGAGAAVGWVLVFSRKRRELDFRKFGELKEDQGAVLQILSGMEEIKLNGCERAKRWDWQRIQARLFHINAGGLAVEQYQELGVALISQLKDLLITVFAAQAVVGGRMTLGMMMAVQYVIGQMNVPLRQLITFMRSLQDARIALERMGEIQAYEEESRDGAFSAVTPPAGSIRLEALAFRYPGAHMPDVLCGLDLEIPEGKVTAIVGPSGSGKTTLLRLLLRLQDPTSGRIRVGDSDLASHDPREWRLRCGVVMQNGYLFADTIARNIALRDDDIDHQRLVRAADLANIRSYVESLPLGWSSKIGAGGDGLSQGQKQRLLIARALYGDPRYLFFDEATSALDAENERTIIENLERFFAGRTVVVIAHRLSTVRRADQIVVLDRGRIVERGPHDELAARRGIYFKLVKNQLELGA